MGERSVSGYHVDAYSLGNIQCPLISWYSSDDVFSMQVPVLSHTGILYPGVTILLGQLGPAQCVLNEDGWMRLDILMYDFTLVIHQVLYAESAADHLPAGSVVIELTVLQWQDGSGESAQQTIGL